MRLLALVVITGLAGCTTALGIHDPSAANPDARGPDADGRTDASTDSSIDAPTDVDAPIDSSPITGSPLLLSEVVLAPNGGEMIEVVNITGHAVDLTDFWLSDNGNYFRLPAGVPAIDSTDFIARFPAGASVPAHGTVTVAVATAAEFTAAYGIAPTFSIADATMIVVDAPGSPNLTSGGELIALFSWDGQTDLVADADLLLAGSPSAGNSLIDKSGVFVDGPDADATPTAYAIDARTISIQMGTPGNGLSTKRIALETGREVHAGNGNGLDGEDETTEDTAATWDSVTFTTPTPGAVPAALLQ